MHLYLSISRCFLGQRNHFGGALKSGMIIVVPVQSDKETSLLKEIFVDIKGGGENLSRGNWDTIVSRSCG